MQTTLTAPGQFLGSAATESMSKIILLIHQMLFQPKPHSHLCTISYVICYMATGAVPVPAPCSRAHTYPALGASQGRQLPSIHSAEQRRKTSRTI